MIGHVLAGVERRDRQDRRQQKIVGFEESADLVAEGVPLEHFFIIVAHVLGERRVEHFGNRRIEQIALLLDKRAQPRADASVELRGPQISRIFIEYLLDQFDLAAEILKGACGTCYDRCNVRIGPRVAQGGAVGDAQISRRRRGTRQASPALRPIR